MNLPLPSLFSTLLVLSPALHAAEPPKPAPAVTQNLATLEARRDFILQQAETNLDSLAKSKEIWPQWAAQYFLFKNIHQDVAKSVLRNCATDIQKPPRAGKTYHKGFFPMWAMLDAYLSNSSQFSEADQKLIKAVYTENDGVALYRGNTSNLSMIAAVNLHLATQEWGRESFSPYVQQDIDKRDPIRTRFLTNRCDSMCRGVSGEFASRPYSVANLVPLLTLWRHTKDPVLKQRALMAYELSIAQAAPFWLNGHWAVASSRSYPEPFGQMPSSNVGYLWYYFGGIAPERPFHSALCSMVADLKDGYLPAPGIVAAGTDRSKSYVARGRFSGPDRYEYTFMNRTYAMFSCMASGKSNIFGQTYPYGIMWNEPDTNKGSFFWITVPGNDGPTRDHAHGVSEHYIQYLQHEGTLIAAIDNLSEKARAHEGCWFPHVLFQTPAGWRAVLNESENSGRLFLHYGSVLIGLQSSEHFTWNTKPGCRVHAGSKELETRIEGENQAFAVESARPEDFPGATPQEQLQAFRDAVVAKTKLSWKKNPEGKTVAYYTNRSGVEMVCPFSRGLKNTSTINGKPLDMDNWPQMDNPWMHQDANSDIVTLRYANSVRTYDIKAGTITDSRQ